MRSAEESLQTVTQTTENDKSGSEASLHSDYECSKERGTESSGLKSVKEEDVSEKTPTTLNEIKLDGKCSALEGGVDLVKHSIPIQHQSEDKENPGLRTSNNLHPELCDSGNPKEGNDVDIESSKQVTSTISKEDKLRAEIMLRDDAGYISLEESKGIRQEGHRNKHVPLIDVDAGIGSAFSNSVTSNTSFDASSNVFDSVSSGSDSILKMKVKDTEYNSSGKYSKRYKGNSHDHDSVIQMYHSLLNNNITRNENSSFTLPQDLLNIFQGILQGLPLDSEVPEKPDWLDLTKFNQGQAFAQKYFFSLTFSEMLSLMMLFSFDSSLQPLIYTGKSSTPYTSFKRYLSTVLRVKSWYEGDIWEEGSVARCNLRTVRGMHLSVSKRMNNATDKELETKLNLSTPRWCPLNKELVEDFSSSCPIPYSGQCPYSSGQVIFINQMAMSVTQFGFVGLAILYPDKFGMGDASDEDLEAFIHLWRVLGYLLGIDDNCNFCNGNLSDVRQRTEQIITYWVKPNLREVGEDWEHMSRCMVEGISYYTPGVTFEVSLKYLCWVIGVQTPRLSSCMTWTHHFMFFITKVVMCFMLRLPGVLKFYNWLLCLSLKHIQEASSEQMQQLENKVYEYQLTST